MMSQNDARCIGGAAIKALALNLLNGLTEKASKLQVEDTVFSVGTTSNHLRSRIVNYQVCHNMQLVIEFS